MLTKKSFTRETHASVPERRADSKDANLLDYTTLPDGWQIIGHLTTGHVAKSTIRCQTCGQVGVLATSNSGHLIVHVGLVSHDTLHPIDYCELSITVN